MRYIFLTIFWGLCLHAKAFTDNDQTIEDVFTQVYKQGIWGKNDQGEGASGGGSKIENTKKYMAFLQNFLKRKSICTVVDLGCGDWEFSQHIDWSGITYVGYDVVKQVIEKNRRKFSTPSIFFFHKDAAQSDLPGADLLICKDVLQHLPEEDILLLCSQFRKYKYCLITNNVDFSQKDSNRKIKRGDCRAIDITKPPFNISAKKVLTYRADVVKQVVLITK